MSTTIERERLNQLEFSNFEKPSKKKKGKQTQFLLVANVENVSDESLISRFSPFGKVKRIIRGESERKLSAICVISNEEDAKNVMDNLKGKEIRVDLSTEIVNRVLYMEYWHLKDETSEEERRIMQHTLNMKSKKKMSTEWPGGLFLVYEFVSLEEEKKLVEDMERFPWSTKIGRRVQHYGFEFNYQKKYVDGKEEANVEEIPEFLHEIVERISRLKNPLDDSIVNNRGNCIFKFSEEDGREGNPLMKPIDQITVNEYVPGRGISPHIDTHSAFEGGIASLSLDSQITMEFEHPNGERTSVYLPRRSLVILTGESRYLWTHGIPSRKTDLVELQDLKGDNDMKQRCEDATNRNLNAVVIERNKRISLTMRCVNKSRVCDCKFPDQCDSQNSKINLPDRIQVTGEE
eukprot:TRINITY_DN4332_c0_g1_i2.p1 TRINITY_DN4332_c0_g1~~TRINITY_DN4332_c0_g1_i2.p1  ORF type:complete len:405 (+),score=120.73 TRINITY_DN4332_c0_g1_i2:102-1316(+)